MTTTEQKCEWTPCENEGKVSESDGHGSLFVLCLPHRRILRKQKKLDNNL